MLVAANSIAVAKIEVRRVDLQRLVGAYRLDFIVEIRTINQPDERWITIDSGEVVCRTDSGPRRVGIARPARREVIKYCSGAHGRLLLVALDLTPFQLAKLEDARAGADMTFDLAIAGEGGSIDNRAHDGPINAELAVRSPRSEWIESLRAAGALDAVLLELPFHLDGEMPSAVNPRAAALRLAQRHLAEGRYAECVAQCRDVLELLGANHKGLDLAGSGRAGLSQSERETLIFASVRHATHLAHHTAGGAVAFTREDAQFVLNLTAVCAARGPLPATP